jgi:hypothetical protein
MPQWTGCPCRRPSATSGGLVAGTRFPSRQRPSPEPQSVVCLEGGADSGADDTAPVETQVRRGLEQTQDPLAVLYEGSPTRTTGRPTGTRILKALACAQITLTHVEMGTKTGWLSPCSPHCMNNCCGTCTYLRPFTRHWLTRHHSRGRFTRNYS